MTIIEAIQANPIFSMVTLDFLNVKLNSRSIDGSAYFDESELKNVELVSADLYMAICLMPEFKEGQLSVKFSEADLKARAKSIYTKYDDAKLAEFEPKPINFGVSGVYD